MKKLVELHSINPRILLEIVYATPHNFTGKKVYSSPRCFLCEKTAEKLDRVQCFLEKKGLGLKVFDGYRPLSVQKIFWSLVPDPRYVADPAEGSMHNRGTAVDLTLVDSNGNELLMPTLFDDFSERAHRQFSGPGSENSQILEEAMLLEGFIPCPTEWWHFDDPDWSEYPLLDIPFEEL